MMQYDGNISIHSAIASGDGINTVPSHLISGFQSTPPSLAETSVTHELYLFHIISIHSAIASGDRARDPIEIRTQISIHSAIASGDGGYRILLLSA